MPDQPAPTTSLRRDEAAARSQLIDVHETAIELDLTDDVDTFSSHTTISFSCRIPGAATFLDFKGRELHRVRLNGADLDPGSWAAGRIPLPDLAAANVVEVDGLMSYSSDGEGLHRHVDPADGNRYLYAMSFLDAGPKWFACFDQPDLKSRYRLEVAAPSDWTVVGNGPSSSSEPGRWTITPPEPLATYFVTLVAGPYASVYDEHDGIPLGFHVRASLAGELEAEAPDMIEVTRACLDYYHEIFEVRYPFGEYHQAFVPDFNAGAMENPGCVTFRDQFIYRSRATAAERATRAGVIAHEMAHMWFGDLVTMRWWDDLWLNESFAEYLGHRCCTEVTKYPLWVEFGILRKDWGSMADQAPSTHPVAGNGAADAESALWDFDGISYAKGAAALRQLVAYLTDEVFLSGLRRYFDAHRFGNATFADLITSWNASGAVRLEEWAAAWLRTSGMDLVTVVDGCLVRVPPDQTPEVARPHAISVGFFAADGSVLGQETVTLEAPVALRLPEETALVLPDLGDDTWARIRFGTPGFTEVGAVAAQLSGAPGRVVVINAVRDAVRNGELGPDDACEILLALVGTETSDVVLASTLGFALDQLAGPYLPPERRPAALHRIGAVVVDQLASSVPGSDRQLALFRVAARCAEDAELLRDQLDGRRLPTGLVLDHDLAWSLVDRLAVMTRDHSVIERQQRVDPSAAGRVHAARTRAGLPDPEAKAAAWRLLAQPSDASGYELYATAEGFFRPDQSELCRPYAVRYFHEMPETAGFRSGWVLGRLALSAYPASFSTQDMVDLADRVLARDDVTGPVRRSLVDGTDKLRRAAASRQRFSRT